MFFVNDGGLLVGGLLLDSDDDDVKLLSILKHSNTAAPTELLLVSIEDIKVHLFKRTSYFSTEFSDELPSFPPRASKLLSQATTSCVDLKHKQTIIRARSLLRHQYAYTSIN